MDKKSLLSKYDNANINPEGFFIKTENPNANTNTNNNTLKESEVNNVKERLQQLKQEKEKEKEKENSKITAEEKTNYSLSVEKV